MLRKQRYETILAYFSEKMPKVTTELEFGSVFQLLVATVLSAQCTDKRINQVTPELFRHYPDPKSMAQADVEDIFALISSVSYPNSKAKHLSEMSKMLMKEFGGEVPDTMEDLQKLPGIGRKSANVIMLEAFNNPQGIAVDTHAKRISRKIGFSKNEDPEKIEQDLLKVIPKEYYYDANHLFVWHGRKTCDSRKPKCEICKVKEFCDTYKNVQKLNK